MKTFLIIIALIILTIISSYAQTTKNCCCKKKTAHHTTMHHKQVAKADKTKPPMFTNRIHNTKAEVVPGTYTGNDVWSYEYVTRLDKTEKVELNKESEYTGNYPKPTLQDTRVSPQEARGGNARARDLCLWNCK